MRVEITQLSRWPEPMCNLYSVTTNRDAIRQLSRAMSDRVGNLPELPGIYPDYLAPIVRMDAVGQREIVLARWGLPSLKDAPTEKPNRGTTNVRHPWFVAWKGYLGVEHRCLVPLTRFAEPCKLDDGSSGNAWFALSKDELLTFFAGIFTEWTGTRRKDEGPLKHLVFAFFTTEPNDVVGAIHQKAMPVIINSEQERETWLTAPWSEAKKLQRPMADGELEIVHGTALKYLPGVEGIPSGDPLSIAGAGCGRSRSAAPTGMAAPPGVSHAAATASYFTSFKLAADAFPSRPVSKS